MKILVAVDGSACATQAVRYVCRHFTGQGAKAAITLVNADPPLPAGVTRHLGAADVKAYHEENGTEALRVARREFARARIPFKQTVIVGAPAEAIVSFAQKGRFHMIVMGSHGYSAFKNFLLGSVVTKVLSQSKIPVLVVR